MNATVNSDPRVVFAAERTLLAWQRSSLSLMGFGFLIERFSLFLDALRREPAHPSHHLFSLLIGVGLILLGSVCALASSLSFSRFVKSVPTCDIPKGFWTRLGPIINSTIAAMGLVLAAYLSAAAR